MWYVLNSHIDRLFFSTVGTVSMYVHVFFFHLYCVCFLQFFPSRICTSIRFFLLFFPVNVYIFAYVHVFFLLLFLGWMCTYLRRYIFFFSLGATGRKSSGSYIHTIWSNGEVERDGLCGFNFFKINIIVKNSGSIDLLECDLI